MYNSLIDDLVGDKKLDVKEDNTIMHDGLFCWKSGRDYISKTKQRKCTRTLVTELDIHLHASVCSNIFCISVTPLVLYLQISSKAITSGQSNFDISKAAVLASESKQVVHRGICFTIQLTWEFFCIFYGLVRC
ncbi:hypothetical protein Cni_G25339 [Canna indica]|uniref:Uncharacterized protein n=1 Tax=Canna indica TaxID=4628 RepID=A0AAQ3KZU8_9LILI|nr:hypothetical protein Cni_G25339 [Canna indica]